MVIPKRIYIVGPMRGIPGYNRPEFDAAAARILDRGDIPITPVQMDVAAGVPLEVFDPTRLDIDWSAFPPGFSRLACFHRCMQAVADADEIMALDGWWNSKGAIAEIAAALWLDRPVFDERGRRIMGVRR